MSKKRTSRVLVADPDPAVMVTSVAAGVSKDQAYIAPTDAERFDAGIGLARLAICDLGGAAELLGPLGFTVTTDVDPATSRRYALAVSESLRALRAADKRRRGLLPFTPAWLRAVSLILTDEPAALEEAKRYARAEGRAGDAWVWATVESLAEARLGDRRPDADPCRL